MRLLIVHYGLFDSNSGIQAFHFGNLLTDLGWEVTLACEGEIDRVRRVGEPRFECIDHVGLPSKLEQWRPDPRECLICAWTPRENVRREVTNFASQLGVPYVVHLEDNEEHLLARRAGDARSKSCGSAPATQEDELPDRPRPPLPLSGFPARGRSA